MRNGKQYWTFEQWHSGRCNGHAVVRYLWSHAEWIDSANNQSKMARSKQVKVFPKRGTVTQWQTTLPRIWKTHKKAFARRKWHLGNQKFSSITSIWKHWACLSAPPTQILACNAKLRPTLVWILLEISQNFPKQRRKWWNVTLNKRQTHH